MVIIYAIAILTGVVDWGLLINSMPEEATQLGFFVFSGQLFVYVQLVAFALRGNPALR